MCSINGSVILSSSNINHYPVPRNEATSAFHRPFITRLVISWYNHAVNLEIVYVCNYLTKKLDIACISTLSTIFVPI